MNIHDVWRSLGGPEIKHGRSRAFWRDGQDLNVHINFDRDVWFDFVTNEGGGVVSLVMTVMGYDAKQAYRWLESVMGYQGKTRFRRENVLPKRPFIWRQGLISDLERKKKAAYEKYIATGSDADEQELSWHASRLYDIQSIGHNNLCKRFDLEYQRDPKGVTAILDAATRDAEEAVEITKQIVEVLASVTT
jgi:hypothetical protein